jgi:hypothetical protein
VIALAACGGGTTTSSGPSGGQSPVASPAASVPASLPAGGDPTATLVTTGGADANVNGSWSLDGQSANVSPTASLIAAVFTKTIANEAAGYGDFIVLSMGGPVVNGTQPTSKDFKLGFTISRSDAAGNDIFDHTFASEAGECSVTMTVSAAITGTFSCSNIGSDTGQTVDAEGTFTL